MLDELDLLTVEEAAPLLRMTPRGLQCWRSKGYGPKAIRVGRQMLYPRDEIARFIRELRDSQAARV
jgi:DNA-binding transcriptional MerR regulator